MSPTWIGILVLVIGAVLLARGTIAAMFVLVVSTSLLGGSSAINLPALGGASIQPTYLALGLLTARVVLAGRDTPRQLADGVRENAMLLVFCVYGAISSVMLPRIFQGMMDVTPMRYTNTLDIFTTSPLQPSPQNVTSAVYLFGTLIAAVMGGVVARSIRSPTKLATIWAWVTFAHVVFGVVVIMLISAGRIDVVDFVRNGSYAQLNQTAGSFVRISGFFPETSAYAGYGIFMMALMVECWMRDLVPRLTGWAALAVTLALVFSTSSSAYIGIGGYGAILLARLIFFPGAIPPRKLLMILGLGGIGMTLILAIAVFQSAVIQEFSSIIRAMTVDKADSVSGQQRKFWAQQGIDAFKNSYGLGIGAGSFRSSSLATAIAGSLGVVGLASFSVYLWSVLKPLRASTYGGSGATQTQAMGASFSWAVVTGTVVLMVSAVSPDPGLLFGIMSGMALALRAASSQRPGSAAQSGEAANA